MTYEQNKRRIAEKLAKKYFPSKNELAIVAMIPLAEICLEEMAEQFRLGHAAGFLMVYRGEESTDIFKTELLTQNGLIP